MLVILDFALEASSGGIISLVKPTPSISFLSLSSVRSICLFLSAASLAWVLTFYYNLVASAMVAIVAALASTSIFLNILSILES